MAQNDFFKRYLDAGLEFTAMTQAKAEALVKDLVSAGEVQADQARDAVSELLERSRKSSERLIDTVRAEVKAQITNLGLASKEDVERAEQRLMRALGIGLPSKDSVRTAANKAPAAAKDAAEKATAAVRSTAKKAANKAGAKKTAAKRSTAKKSTATKSTAKKTAKKSTTKSTKKSTKKA